jgi:hypothetical protein
LPNNFYKLFSNTLKEVFNETLVFAFVFGSIAKQYATSDHDTPSARKVDASPSRPFLPPGGLMEPFNASLQRDRKS